MPALINLQGFQGDYALELDTMPENVFIWAGLSSEAIDALEELRNEGLLHYLPGSWFDYNFDGCTLNFPLATIGRKHGYAEPHWMPTLLVAGKRAGKEVLEFLHK